MRCSLKEPVFVSGQVNEVKIIVEDGSEIKESPCQGKEIKRGIIEKD